MNETELIPNGQKNDLIGSSAFWFITCIFVSILPFILSYCFKSLSRKELVSVSPYLEDILLIVFPISCSILALYFDSSKMIDKKYKRFLFGFGGISAILSLTYYVFISSATKGEQGYEDNIMIFISIMLIIICTFIGCLSNMNHDKNYEKYRQSINKKYNDLSTKYNKLQVKHAKFLKKKK